jgi:hypothetical protein
MARQPKLTDEARDLYLRAVSAGVPPEVAAVHAGFSRATLRRRLQGRTPRDAEFRAAHDKALAAFQITLVATVARAALTDARLALELLTRRFSADWGRSRSTDSLDDLDDRTRLGAEAPIVLDPALIDELVPRLLEAGRRLSGGTTDEADLDISDFEDDGTAHQPSDSDEPADQEVNE